MLKVIRLKMLRVMKGSGLAVLGLMLCSLLVPDELRAEMIVEKNKILLGDDYSVFSLKRGERAKCRKACEKDRVCQSWTFVRPDINGIAQCRLKRSLAAGFKNDCCVSGYKKQDFRDYGQNNNRRKKVEICDKWAGQAVKLNEENVRNVCGYRGRAWHSNEDRHFRRCMQIGPKARATERAGQKKALDVCVAELGYGKRARCDHYARIAVAQNTSRVKASCRIVNNQRWSKAYKDHFRWCLAAKKRETHTEQAAREEALRQCYSYKKVASGPCHDYAELAINHFRKNIAKGCDLHGPRWHNNYRRHVSWCRRAGPKQSSKETNKRRLTLKTCRLFGKIGIQWR